MAFSTVLSIGNQRIIKMWGANTKHLFTPNNSKLAELHALISVIKAIASWRATSGAADCRRAAGGLGYSHYAGLGKFLQNIDVAQTWEGDNNVLLQQTGKYLLDLLK